MFRQGAEIIHPVTDCGAQMGVAIQVLMLNLVPVLKITAVMWRRSDQENEACDL